jgi:hypothetical protein
VGAVTRRRGGTDCSASVEVCNGVPYRSSRGGLTTVCGPSPGPREARSLAGRAQLAASGRGMVECRGSTPAGAVRRCAAHGWLAVKGGGDQASGDARWGSLGRVAKEHESGPVHSMAYYHRGYTGRDYHVTGGHETEALAAQRAKRLNRFQMLILKLLGLKNEGPRP